MRLFVAVDLPATVKDELDHAVDDVRPSLAEARWVPRDNLHLTVSFLGEVGDERVEGIVAAMQEALTATAPFVARLAGSGAFPSARRARVLWAGLEAAEDRLASVANACIRALEPLGFPAESRPWTAHVTVARLREPGEVSRALPLTLEPVAFPIEAVTLFRSRLGRPAPRYEAIAAVPFGA
ncbi:MAG: RNA 2',3'-cyclic phosphodiesterase [Actinomycetota bacterium]